MHAGLSEALLAEDRLLKYVKYPMEKFNLKIGPGAQDFIHGLKGGPMDGEALVLLPGYGAGCAFYYRVLAQLCSKFRVYTIDVLGTGLSGRPSFPCKNRQQSEDFFIDSLLKWQESENLDQILLMGHSLGGYLAAKYALQYQKKVKALFLICPAGVSTRMDLVSNMIKRNKGAFSQLFISIGKMGYEMGVTPQSIIRSLGPVGVGLIHGYVTNRLQTLPFREACVVEKYLYQIFALRGSGEYALRYIIGPDAQGYDPLELKLQELNIPLQFIYGEFDWTDPKCADRVIKRMQHNQAAKHVIKGAGHQTYVDNPDEFVRKFFKAYTLARKYNGSLEKLQLDEVCMTPSTSVNQELPSNSTELKEFRAQKSKSESNLTDNFVNTSLTEFSSTQKMNKI